MSHIKVGRVMFTLQCLTPVKKSRARIMAIAVSQRNRSNANARCITMATCVKVGVHCNSKQYNETISVICMIILVETQQ